MERVYGWYEPNDFIKKHPKLAYYWFFGHPCTDYNSLEEMRLKVGGFDERFSILEDTECWMRICGDPRKERALKDMFLFRRFRDSTQLELTTLRIVVLNLLPLKTILNHF